LKGVGVEDKVSARSSFVANAHNELCILYGKRRLVEKNSESVGGSGRPFRPFPLNPPLFTLLLSICVWNIDVDFRPVQTPPPITAFRPRVSTPLEDPDKFCQWSGIKLVKILFIIVCCHASAAMLAFGTLIYIKLLNWLSLCQYLLPQLNFGQFYCVIIAENRSHWPQFATVKIHKVRWRTPGPGNEF